MAPDAALFLDRRSRAYLGDAIGFLHSPEALAIDDNLAAAVRKGGTVVQNVRRTGESPLGELCAQHAFHHGGTSDGNFRASG